MTDSNPRVTDDTRTAYRRALERVETDLVDVVRRHARALGAQLVTVALLEVVAAVLQDVVAADPSTAPRIAETLSQLQLVVTPTNERPH